MIYSVCSIVSEYFAEDYYAAFFLFFALNYILGSKLRS